jgi:D-alanyl-D-alanine carboxypeptidase
MTTRTRIAATAAVVLLAAQLGASGSWASASAQRVTARATAPPFGFTAHRLSARVRTRVTGSSWHKGCPVGLSGLRYVRMSYWGFDGKAHRGDMIVNKSAVAAARTAFGQLYSKRFPIRRMHLVDRYGADDYTSIEADNTSSFNCRRATGSTHWSQHAYGRAIDINPIENPYVYANGTTTHKASRPYLDRSPYRSGMAVKGRALVKAFDAVGWGWGGRWKPARDLQHFSSTGR